MNSSRLTVGIVDYGIGNQTSMVRCIQKMGYRAILSDSSKILERTNVLLLPGVGAFPLAMEQLHTKGLVDFLKQTAAKGKPLIGVCLGMQLLTNSSTEQEFTLGLGIIPGAVESIVNPRWHIGWNDLEVNDNQPLLQPSNNEMMYFNHSYCYFGSKEWIAATCKVKDDGHTIVAAIRKGLIWGFQFHPEKSQHQGFEMLKRLIISGVES